MKDKILVILPVIDEETLKILYFVDYKNRVYKDYNELLNEENGDSVLFFLLYELAMAELFDWCENQRIEYKLGDKVPYYLGGRRQADYYTANIKIKSLKTDPEIDNVKCKYKGFNFKMMNFKNFKRDITDFNLKQEDLPGYQHYMEYWYKEIVPLTTHKTLLKTIASTSRNILGDPFKMGVAEKNAFYSQIQSSRIGGLYYLRPKYEGKRWSVIYDYDISSMYPALLNDKYYPALDDMPLEIPQLVEVEEGELAFYHIKTIYAIRKPKHFPTIWTQNNIKQKMINKADAICNDNAIICVDVPDILGWITSIDLKMLRRDYDIKDLEIDTTYLYTDLVKGDKYFEKLKDFYKKKQESKGYLRELYKIIIDSYSGSLAMKSDKIKRIDRLGDTDYDEYERKPGETPKDLYAFMTAYGRYEISELALKAGYDNVISIDTDGIFALNTDLDSECSTGLGSLRLDKVMYDAQWFGQKQYEYKDAEEGEWIPTIAGLPGYMYKHGKLDYSVPQIIFDKQSKRYIKRYIDFELNGGKDGTDL